MISDTNLKNIFIQGAIPASLIAASIQQHSSRDDIGGHSIFIGQVRADMINEKKIIAIEYTSNQALALKQMQVIRENVFSMFPVTCLQVYHSLGRIGTGEICFFVLVASPRRKASIHACEEAVEKIKTGLPIWGKEIFEDDSHQWKINT